MTTVFHLDYESRSTVSLPDRGLSNYATDPSTEVILAAYAEGDNRVQLWQPHLGPMPNELHDALTDPWVEIHAWNAPFEREITKHVLKIDKPTDEFADSMVVARSLSMPGSLEDVCEILKIPLDQAKIADGSRLIKLFTETKILGGEVGLFGVSKPGFNDWNTHPADWELFCSYCKNDVVAERAIGRKLCKFPLPDEEVRGWLLDQKINSAGIPCDMDLVTGAKFIADKEMALLRAQLKERTELDNPNSNEQMLGWCQTQNYGFSSLGKAFVNRAMSGECDLTPLCREVLEIRRMTSKTSVNKFSAISDNVCSDGRLRNQFSFMGAPRTGRWSGKGSQDGSSVQLQNLAKPNKEVEKHMDRALELVRIMDYDTIKAEFGQPLEVASSVIRGAFRAELGMKLVIADLAGIEARVLGWLSNCKPLLDVFHAGRDIYVDLAATIYHKAYEDVTKKERADGKVGILACGYQMGAGEEIVTEDGDHIKTGLLGYAQAFNIEMTPEDAERIIQAYRTKYKEVVNYWWDLERAGIAAVRGHGPQTIGRVTFEATGKSMLRVLLPSGRYLTYVKPEVHEGEYTYKDKKTGRSVTKTKDVLSYMGLDQTTRQWVRMPTRGGHLTENFCQAVARDILLHGLTLADETGFEIVAHVHDEIVAQVSKDGTLGVQDLIDCMKAPPTWAKDLPLDASGEESDVSTRRDDHDPSPASRCHPSRRVHQAVAGQPEPGGVDEEDRGGVVPAARVPAVAI
jgi:DNA polymerase